MISTSSRFSGTASLSRAALGVLLLSVVAATADAQVGHLPRDSPFRDQKIGQTLTIAAGYLKTNSDPAGVAPKSGPLMSLRYDIGVGGPTAAYVRYSTSPTSRNLIIPTLPAATRLVGTKSASMHIADLGLDLALTGKKSWHRMVPSLTVGVGYVTDLQDADAGGYKFGGKFALTYGLALRVVPGGRLSYRFDLTNHYWQYQYPDAYFVPASDQTSVLSDIKQRTVWKSNYGLRAGLSLQLFQ